ncbi:Hypothetical protein PHPALM_15223 [Phytophthora palmivora]|uniref:Uncharacterized protein n=1 Tax=Phytophthora palmivora TaxID=4796 RepID=A0A2P4XST1_9STRA|nr:Hypothetical protein PHPALM_15223 [Phytophthora palmivora]
MELMSLTTKSVQTLTKDLKGTRLANLRDSLTTWSKPKGYLDRKDKAEKEPRTLRELLLSSFIGTASSTTMWSGSSKSGGALGSASCL